MAVKVTGNAATVVEMFQALFGAASSNQIFTTYVQAIDASPQNLAVYLNALTESSFSQVANDKLALVVLSNLLGADSSNSVALQQAVGVLLNANQQNRGVVIFQLAQLLTGLEGDHTYGVAASSWNSTVFDSYTKSSTPGYVPAQPPPAHLVELIGYEAATHWPY